MYIIRHNKVVSATKGRNKAGAVHLEVNASVSNPYADWIRTQMGQRIRIQAGQ